MYRYATTIAKNLMALLPKNFPTIYIFKPRGHAHHELKLRTIFIIRSRSNAHGCINIYIDFD